MNVPSLRRIHRLNEPEATEAQHAYGPAAEEFHLRDYLKILVKRRRIATIVFLIVVGVGSYFPFTATPIYTSTAIIKIEPQGPSVTGLGEIFRITQIGQYDYYQTQFKLLESRELIARIIRDSNLESNKVFTNARVTSSSAVHRIRSWLFGMLNSTIANITTLFREKPKARPLVAKTEEKTESGHPGKQPTVSRGHINRYKSFLDVDHVKTTRLVEVTFSTPDPELSQELANAHVRGFIRMNLDNRFELTNEAREFLDVKNTELKAKIERSEDALNRFRQKHGVVSFEKGENIVVDRLVDLNKQLTAATAQRFDAESIYKLVENKATQHLSQVLNQGLIPTLRTTLVNLEAEQVRSSAVLKPDHPRMKEINQQINELKRALNAEITNAVRSIQDSYLAARGKEQYLQAEAQKQQQAALNLKQLGVEYTVLQEEVNVNRSLYESVLKRLNETHISSDLVFSNIQIVQQAEKPGGASSPDIGSSLVLTVLLGLFVSGGIVFVKEYFDSSVNTPQHVWRAVALSTFGVVPDLNSLKRRLVSWNRPAIPLLRRLTRPQVQAPQSASEELILSHHPLSLITESYRTIRTALLFSQAEKPPQVILLTSPSQGEGKTVTTLNLAIALAQEGHRILVIDADLRKGCCHVRLGIRNHRGLSNILTGNLSLEEGILATSVSGLSLLSRGICPPNPSDLLGSARMRRILDDLRASFSFILIDSPPAIAVTDAAVISVICDGVLLVLHAQKTTTAYARQALDRLDAVRAPVLGVVLNGIDVRNPDYAYYHSYYGSAYGSGGELERGNGAGRTVKAASHQELSEVEPVPVKSAPGTVPAPNTTRGGEPENGTERIGKAASHQELPEVEPVPVKSAPGTVPAPNTTRGGEPENRAERIVKAASHQELPEVEPVPVKSAPGTVPGHFFVNMTAKLIEAAGPMAFLIIRDQIVLLGESRDTFPKNRLRELVESVCKEILNDDLRRNFNTAVAEEIRNLSSPLQS